MTVNELAAEGDLDVAEVRERVAYRLGHDRMWREGATVHSVEQRATAQNPYTGRETTKR